MFQPLVPAGPSHLTPLPVPVATSDNFPGGRTKALSGAISIGLGASVVRIASHRDGLMAYLHMKNCISAIMPGIAREFAVYVFFAE